MNAPQPTSWRPYCWGATSPEHSEGECEHFEAEPAYRLDCAWCGKVLRQGPAPTSHGICPTCRAKFEEGNHDHQG